MQKCTRASGHLDFNYLYKKCTNVLGYANLNFPHYDTRHRRLMRASAYVSLNYTHKECQTHEIHENIGTC